MTQFIPHTLSTPKKPAFFLGGSFTFRINFGLHIFVGPNGSGKTETLRSLRDSLRGMSNSFSGRHVVYLSAGRSSPFEHFRSASAGPNQIDRQPAAVGQQAWRSTYWQYEAVPGMFMRLKERPDLLLKVEARLQALYQRRLRLEWAQHGLQVGFAVANSREQYYANAEASGLLQLIPLLAAVYDDGIGVLIVDEPEISMHPQLQAFLLQEMEAFSGDPSVSRKKLIIIATHSPALLPVRKVRDLLQLVFFIDRHTVPIQLAEDAGELKSARMSALISRLSENHKIAFFANKVLLVEGPSDEIIVSGLAQKLHHPLLGNNTQVIPVTGKGQFAETVKLFRLMGKRVFVLADLDALADDNQLVSVFQDAALQFANELGMGSIMDVDRSIRDKFNTLLDKAFPLLPLASTHQYWTDRVRSETGELKAKRRATLAALLSISESEIATHLSEEILALRRRYDALLKVLDSAGCVFLRRGTIENYYFDSQLTSGKPDAAADEIERIGTRSKTEVMDRYCDVVRGIRIAAPLSKINENALLREQLGSLLGAALLIVTPNMADDELNTRAAANLGSEPRIFDLANRSKQNESGIDRRIFVSITSSLFERDNFPFEISDKDNPTAIIEQKLPLA